MALTLIRGTQVKDNSLTSGQVNSSIIIAAGTNAFTGDQSLGGFKITNLANPSSSNDAVNKSYVDNAVTGLLDFKGSADCSANPNYPSASKGDSYYVSVAGKIGGASGKSVEVGDVYIANADNAGGNEASVGTSWFILEHSLLGALIASNNLSDLTNAGTARTNLGFTADASSLVISANYASMRTLLGLSIGTDIYSKSATDTLLTAKAPLASPSFTGVPVAPTASGGTNTTQLATTQFVSSAIAALPGGSTMVNRETPSGTVNGSNTTFTLAFTPVSGTDMVFNNGILQEAGSGTDYTISTNTITFLTGAIPVTGDKVRVTYWK